MSGNDNLDTIHRKLDRILTLLGDVPTVQAEPATIPAPPVQTTWRTVGLEYRSRFLKANAGKVLDYHITRFQQVWEDLARVVDGYANPLLDLQRGLDNFFGDSWARKHQFPPTALLKSFEKYHAGPPAVKREDEPDPEEINARRIREHREREERALREKLNGQSETASKPPPLDELLAGIGRKV